MQQNWITRTRHNVPFHTFGPLKLPGLVGEELEDWPMSGELAAGSSINWHWDSKGEREVVRTQSYQAGQKTLSTCPTQLQRSSDSLKAQSRWQLSKKQTMRLTALQTKYQANKQWNWIFNNSFPSSNINKYVKRYGAQDVTGTCPQPACQRGQKLFTREGCPTTCPHHLNHWGISLPLPDPLHNIIILTHILRVVYWKRKLLVISPCNTHLFV